MPGTLTGTEGDVILSDGSTVHVRSLDPTDRDDLVAFFDSLSAESRRRRFFRSIAHLEGALLDRLLDVDQVNAIAVVAMRQDRIVGVGRAHRGGSEAGAPGDPQSAEVSFAVDDGMHGLGIATILLEMLASRARVVGITRFDAITQADNGDMLRVFRTAGYRPTFKREPDDPGVIAISFPIDDDESVRTARWVREHSAAAASLRPLLRPESIAVIGVSSTRSSPGRIVMRELIAHGFTGPVYPVNPQAGTIDGVAAFARIKDIPSAIGPVDLAVVAVPAAHVLTVANECADAGVRGLLVLSSGFAESGPEGRADQEALVAVCRRSGMRLIGPNCLGIITTDPLVSAYAMFTGLDVLPGGVALMSQSGAIAITMTSLATRRGVGFSSVVSVGNKADVSGNDLLEYWVDDESTDVIALYLESFGNPRRFARIARQVGRKKPIIAIKAARSSAGAKAAASHTAALTASDATVDALFRQAGVLRVDDPGELLLLAAALERTTLPTGRRVAIVGNAGGLGILMADALACEQLALAELASDTVAALQAHAPSHAAVTNPVDLTATVSATQFGAALRVVLDDPGIDAVVCVYVPVLADEAQPTFAVIADTTRDSTKPVLLLSDEGAAESGDVSKIAIAATPREAALVLARLAERAEWLARPHDTDLPIPEEVIERIRELVEHNRHQNETGWLPSTTAFEIFRLAGIPTATPVTADDAEQAAEAATTMGFPVCVKAANPTLMHKSDIGAVHVGLRDEFGVVCAFQSIEQALGEAMQGVIVQPVVPPGVEMIIGIENDPQFGPLVVVGAGGRTAELWRDTTVHLAPVNFAEADLMISSLRSHPLLTGFRGAPPADRDALIDAVVRLAQLAVDVPDIAELDANPVIVHPHGVVAVDVKVRAARNPNAERDTTRIMR